MIASDVMTRNVISVPPDATIAEAVELMLERGISGLLVVDSSGTLVGIVTEGDLLRRDEIGTRRHRSWWLRLIASPSRQAADFTRTHGRKVADVMTHDVLTVDATSPLTDIVALMEEHRVKRVPVLDGDRVAGVVSRADLLRALSVAARERGAVAADDATIRDRLLTTLSRESWAPKTTLNVTVVNGAVDLWGTISNDQERRAICVMAENTPGVKKVIDHLVFVEAYTGTVIEPPPRE
ncbi:MAG TPA: CBS domain-containing protein [Acetobacteraceae bacterium]|jgi:CBS domain-containing protein|nr:CBS domain-containing protein [Acetobacteraceae bacterium]